MNHQLQIWVHIFDDIGDIDMFAIYIIVLKL